MKSYISIDFGACNIKAAKVSAQLKAPQQIKLNKDIHAGNSTPNIILYDKVGDKLEVKVGIPARNSIDYANKVWQVKPKLAKRDWSKFIENLSREVTAFEVVKEIFDWTWQEITRQFSQKEDWDVVLTVPVSFSAVQKNLIRQAALDAGIPVNSIITEPFAAIFSLEELTAEDGEQIVLIFDFGGSTLDLSLFRIERDDEDLSITELAAAGLKFGGINIDELILEKIFNAKYADELKKIFELDATEKSKVELMNKIAVLKEDIFLNDIDESKDFISDAHGNIYPFELTRDEINSMLAASGVGEKIRALLDELLDDADIDKQEVTTVKAFGGTSSVTYFLQLLTDYFGAEVFDAEDFDPEDDEIYTGVAIGAAKYRSLCDEKKSNVTIKSVVPYSVGLCDGKSFKRYIKRNELCGFVTPFKPLMIDELKKNSWRVPIYQSFTNELTLPRDSEEVVFMGDVTLNADSCQATDAILFKLRVDEAGNLHVLFFEDADNFIEEKVIKIGG